MTLFLDHFVFQIKQRARGLQLKFNDSIEFFLSKFIQLCFKGNGRVRHNFQYFCPTLEGPNKHIFFRISNNSNRVVLRSWYTTRRTSSTITHSSKVPLNLFQPLFHVNSFFSLFIFFQLLNSTAHVTINTWHCMIKKKNIWHYWCCIWLQRKQILRCYPLMKFILLAMIQVHFIIIVESYSYGHNKRVWMEWSYRLYTIENSNHEILFYYYYYCHHQNPHTCSIFQPYQHICFCKKKSINRYNI